MVAVNSIERELLVGECKWRNSFDEAGALRTLMSRAELLRGYDRKHYMIFSKGKFSDGAKARAGQGGDLWLVTLADLYAELRML